MIFGENSFTLPTEDFMIPASIDEGRYMNLVCVPYGWNEVYNYKVSFKLPEENHMIYIPEQIQLPTSISDGRKANSDDLNKIIYTLGSLRIEAEIESEFFKERQNRKRRLFIDHNVVHKKRVIQKKCVKSVIDVIFGIIPI